MPRSSAEVSGNLRKGFSRGGVHERLVARPHEQKSPEPLSVRTGSTARLGLLSGSLRYEHRRKNRTS